MTTIRDAILKDVSQALGRTSPVPPDADNTNQSLPDIIPTPDLDGDSVERFMLKVVAAGASVTRVRSRSQIGSAVLRYLQDNQLAYDVVTSGDPILIDHNWPDELQVESRTPTESDQTSVTGVIAAVAETGSVVLASGKSTPNSLAFLPDNHLAVVEKSQLLTYIDEVFDRFGGNSEAELPRVLNFVTGPSKTADVEQTLQHGAHGPKRMHVILVDE